MFERIKYAIINFAIFSLFYGFFSIKAMTNIDKTILFYVNLIVAFADIAFVNGFKYKKWAYGYLVINRIINFVTIILMAIIVNESNYWLAIIACCFGMYNFILNQWYMVYDDMMYDDIEDCYQYTMYELHNILSSHQKEILEELEQLVDQDKMCTFIATFEAKEIQKMLSVELWGIAFLIQKEDYDSMVEMIEKIN